MATLYSLHPKNPQPDRIEKICQSLRDGAIMLYPTDTVYAIGCDLNIKSAIEKVRNLKKLSSEKPLTFLCPSLSNIASYAQVSNTAYRVMKKLIPGPYTFILPASKLVPKLVMNPKRKTTGIRVPDHPISQAILNNIGNPIISTSAHLPDSQADFPAGSDLYSLFDALDSQVDLIIDNGSYSPGIAASSIIDFTSDEPSIIRRGLGWEELEKILQF
jgi:tRNA threonylcarbamoyl adenosine modification protein (Sua5/YciO/YrdC/YwlC family)